MSNQPGSPTAIAIKDRDPEIVRKTLAGKSEDAISAFLKLHAYAQKNHLGLSTLSHKTGIPTSLLSQGFNASYPGDYDAVAERINTFFWRLEQNEKYGGLHQFVETDMAKSLWSIFEKTRVIRRFQVIESPEQLGKSRAAAEYTERNNSGRTILVKLSGGSRSGCGDFIWELAERLGIPYGIKLREKRLRIKSALESCDLVIIDEAHLMFAWLDGSIRDFLDYLRTDIYADGARGVALIATNSNVLDGINRFRNRARYNIGQLLGRMRNEVIRIDPAEDILLSDVRLLVERYYQPGADLVRRLHEIACRPQLGHFGLLVDILQESWTRAKAKRQVLSDPIVLATAQEILAELKERKPLYEQH